jgi:addiction module HigA family antidote
MSQAELARRMARPVKTISEIATGKAAITPHTALQLEKVLGISADFWNGVEMRYRQAQAEAREASELEHQVHWVRQFPFAYLAKQGLVTGRTSAEKTASLLSFFGISSPSGWHQRAAVTAAYRLPATVTTAYPALTAWLRWGEIAAQDITTAVFDRFGLNDAADGIPALSRVAVFATAVRRLQQLAAAAGVAVVVTPELPDVHVSGSARWGRPDRAIVQVSLRYRSDDQFWFTVLHEMAHLLRGSGRLRG